MVSKGDVVKVKRGTLAGNIVTVRELLPLRSFDTEMAGCRVSMVASSQEGDGEFEVYLDDVEEILTKTFAIRYINITSSGGPGEHVATGYCRLQTMETEEDLRKRLREEGFRHSDAGHNWWVMPAAIMTVEEVNKLGYSVKRR